MGFFCGEPPQRDMYFLLVQKVTKDTPKGTLWEDFAHALVFNNRAPSGLPIFTGAHS